MIDCYPCSFILVWNLLLIKYYCYSHVSLALVLIFAASKYSVTSRLKNYFRISVTFSIKSSKEFIMQVFTISSVPVVKSKFVSILQLMLHLFLSISTEQFPARYSSVAVANSAVSIGNIFPYIITNCLINILLQIITDSIILLKLYASLFQMQ